MLRCRLLVAILVTSGLLASSPPAGAQARRSPASSAAPKPFFDIRDAHPTPVTPSRATRSARSRLRAAGVLVGVDARTGIVRFLAGRAAPLSRAAAAGPRDIAERYLRDHVTALGLARADLGSLELDRRTAVPGGAVLLGFRQYADGIPSFDGGMRVLVDARGRVASVSGAVQPNLAVASVVPRLSATDAMRKLMQDVGVRRPVRVAAGPSGVRRETQFTSGEAAALVVFGQGASARLAWQLDLRAGPAAHYAAVVDAHTGAVLYRANRVKAAANDALVWEQYPGAANGGTPQVRSLTPYLNAGATDLSGPYAHAWSDIDDSDSGNISSDGHIVPSDNPNGPDEPVGRSGAGSFVYGLTTFNSGNAACDGPHPCSWNWGSGPTGPATWRTDRQQNAVQVFYYVNRFRDHLLARPIGFTPSDGNFDNGDRVLVNADDGAFTDRSGTGNGGPDSDHVDNAYMDTPPDGTSPTMAMFLFSNDFAGPGVFRDVNGGDDAEIVYHEYTHGLSGRLVTVSPAGGEQALNGPQSGGMGEGWSDWYAKDFLVGQFPGDDTATPGEVDMGKYVDAIPHAIRSQGLDCPVGAPAAQCPGDLSPHSGGYTYGDFNTMDIDPIAGGREVHEVGEIWAETLWDLRAAVGSEVAKAIVTQGMRISPPEPTFLDERDAILTADRQLFPDGDHSGDLWRVFAARGMGADAISPSQAFVVEGFKRPPTAGLAVSPSPATQGQPVTLDASSSSDPDGHVTTYDFDFQGDGVNDIAGTANPRQSFTYSSAGTFHPTVTVHDDSGFADTAARSLRVDAGPPTTTPTTTPTPTPTATNPLAPQIVLARTGRKGRVRVTVRCDSACAGTAKLTVSRKLAKLLHLGKRRTVGTVRVRLRAAGKKQFTIKLTKRTLRGMKRAGVRRIALRVSATVTDAEHQRTVRRRTSRIRR